MKRSALTAVKIHVIYLDSGWTESNFADIVDVPRKKPKTYSPPSHWEKCRIFPLPRRSWARAPRGWAHKLSREFTPKQCSIRISYAFSQLCWEVCVGKTLVRETPPWIESRTCSVSFSCIRLSMWLLTNSLELRSKVCSCSIPAMLLTACPRMPGCILINWEQSTCLHWASCAKDCAWDHLVITCF